MRTDNYPLNSQLSAGIAVLPNFCLVGLTIELFGSIQALKVEQAKNDVFVEQSLAGQQPSLGRKKYHDCAQRITRIVAQYGQIYIVDYLRGLAHNVNF